MSKTHIYIIPGWGETCNETRYKKLSSLLESKKYTVERIKPDWYKTLSSNIFKPKKDSIIIGFSYGAVIAYLIAKKYQCKKIIFCSLSPIHKVSYKEEYESYLKYMDEELSAKNAKDIKSIKISLKKLKTPYVTLVGEKETSIKADFLVPKTGHFMSSQYIQCIYDLV